MEKKVMFYLSLRDALNICFMVRNFLSDGDSDEEEETETESISIRPGGDRRGMSGQRRIRV